MKSFVVLPGIFFLLQLTGSIAQVRIQPIYAWRDMDYSFPSPSAREEAISSGAFIPGNSLPVGVQPAGERVFISVPRWRPGVPATLGTVQLNKRTSPLAPPLLPYPDFSWHTRGNCSGISNVYRVDADSCGRLWVLDPGSIEGQRVCPPQLLIFDLSNDKLIRRHRFPDDVITPTSLLANILVDYRGQCSDVFAYIADVDAFGLVVHDYRNDRSWRVVHNFFYPDPLAGRFRIAGTSFDLMDGILALALSPYTNGDRTLYFSSLAGFRLFWVPTSIIRHEGLSNGAQLEFRYSEAKPSQSSVMAMDPSGILFFPLLGRTSIACWNIRAPHVHASMREIIQDETTLQFPSDLTIGNDQSLWVISDRFQRFFTGTIDRNDINFRVLKVSMADVNASGLCEVSPPPP